MAKKPYIEIDDVEQGTPNLSVLQNLQVLLTETAIDSMLFATKVTIVASGTAGVAATIPLGAEIVDARCVCTNTVGAGTGRARVRIGGGGSNITDAFLMTTAKDIGRAAVIDTTYSRVTAAGIEVFTATAADAGFVYIIYKK
jgi:hypothetical protein